MAYMVCTDGDNTRGRISILHPPQSRLGIWRLGIRDSIRVMHGYDAQPLPRRGEAPAGREPALFCNHLQAESLHSFVATCRQRASRAASQCDAGCGGLKRQRGAGSWICEHEAHACKSDEEECLILGDAGSHHDGSMHALVGHWGKAETSMS